MMQKIFVLWAKKKRKPEYFKYLKICMLRSIILSFLCNSEYKLVKIDIFHVCVIHHWPHSGFSFFSKLINTWDRMHAIFTRSFEIHKMHRQMLVRQLPGKAKQRKHNMILSFSREGFWLGLPSWIMDHGFLGVVLQFLSWTMDSTGRRFCAFAVHIAG